VEIRARYLLVGLFVLIVAIGGAGFIYWLANTGGLGERVSYRIRFDGPISGLTRGSAVQFNGLTVGEVTDLRLVPDNPSQVMATIAVDSGTPVRSDTHIGLDFGGLTGTATVAMSGGTTAVPASTDGGPPMLVADPNALKGVTQAARDVLGQISRVVADNADPFRAIVGNIQTFSDALSRNSDKVDSILQGLSRLTGGGEDKNPPKLYDLTAPRDFPAIAKIPNAQLAVPQPTALVTLDTQRILEQSADGDSPAFEGSQWADSLPLLFQARIVQSFENANYLKAAVPSDSFTGDYQLIVDLRKFRLATTPNRAGEIEFSAKISGNGGKIVGGRIFAASVPATGDDVSAAVGAMSKAFDQAIGDLVVWALATIPDGAAAPAPEEPQLDSPAPSGDTPQDAPSLPQADAPKDAAPGGTGDAPQQ
jgi:phospholipid/cholesterol/gamma-HCH transport system substrate-binding protein